MKLAIIVMSCSTVPDTDDQDSNVYVYSTVAGEGVAVTICPSENVITLPLTEYVVPYSTVTVFGDTVPASSANENVTAHVFASRTKFAVYVRLPSVQLSSLYVYCYVDCVGVAVTV